MSFLPYSVQKLIDEFSRLPGVGVKTAQRLTFFLLKSSDNLSNDLGEALLNFKKGTVLCGNCWNLTNHDPCRICTDPHRDTGTICVVEDVLDVIALEKIHDYKGVYHVLHGALSPIDGISPSDIKAEELLKRLKNADFPLHEIILATNPSLEGEATATYLTNLLKPLKVKTTRIARGLPVGGDLDYADETTIRNALEGRKEY